MPSSIPGYEYDVFISYRHKDNKYDGWVTEFILNLRKELEATFKEEIFIYSDENEDDGLQEIHQVKESLHSKLRCLIFIPIISQTYCDPKCYAWTDEFLVFKRIASEDPFGLKVKLESGNVISRIVPVRIHELDAQDKILLEQETGGALRSIDFIFRATGVNRPLRANEDHPHENLNKTYYRDQINKVANLTKEIILALKTPQVERSAAGPVVEVPQVVASRRQSRMAAAALLILLLIASIYFFPWSNSTPVNDLPTIAVLPLKAIGDLDESQPLADGVTDVIRSNLGMFPELKVKSRTSVERYRNSQLRIPEIAKELGVLYVLEGSAQKIGDEFRIVVQLIDARIDNQVWSKQFDGKFTTILESQRRISESIASALKATITPGIASRISQAPTSNFEAYDLFLRAKQASRKYEKTSDKTHLYLAIRLMVQALEKDTTFAKGYAWLAGLKTLQNNSSGIEANDSAFFLAHRALGLDSTLAEALVVLSELYYIRRDDIHALRYTYDALRAGWADSVSTFHLIKRLGSIYARVGDVNAAMYLFDTVLSSNQKNPEILAETFYALASSHQVDKLLLLQTHVEQGYPENDLTYLIPAHIALERKDYAEMKNILGRRYTQTNDQVDGYDAYDLIYIYLLRKQGLTKEYQLFVQAMEKDPDAYMHAQLLMIRQDYDKGLQLLRTEEIGWYTLNLCMLNPIFEKSAADPRFREFMDRNRDMIMEKQDRIHLHEQQGHLPRPRDFIRGLQVSH